MDTVLLLHSNMVSCPVTFVEFLTDGVVMYICPDTQLRHRYRKYYSVINFAFFIFFIRGNKGVLSILSVPFNRNFGGSKTQR